MLAELKSKIEIRMQARFKTQANTAVHERLRLKVMFAVAILMSLSLSFWEAGIMFVLFAGQLFFPQAEVRWGFGVAYLTLALRWIVVERRAIPALFRTARKELSQSSAPRERPDG